MSHSDIGRWARYVRGELRRTEVRAMTAHLDAGCRGCGAMVQLLQSLDLDRDDRARQTPPERARRAVRALFGLRLPEASGRRTIQMRPAFDSAMHAPPAGVRSAASTAREIRYQSEDFSLVVSMQPRLRRAGGVVTGQLLSALGEPIGGAATGLVVGRRLVACAASGGDGLFEIELHEELPAVLLLMPDERTVVRAPLAVA